MFAVLAVVSFIVALILHLVGGHGAKYVTDFELIGFILVAAHLAWGFPLPWARPRP